LVERRMRNRVRELCRVFGIKLTGALHNAKSCNHLAFATTPPLSPFLSSISCRLVRFSGWRVTGTNWTITWNNPGLMVTSLRMFPWKLSELRKEVFQLDSISGSKVRD